MATASFCPAQTLTLCVCHPRTSALLPCLPYSYLSPYIHHVVLKELQPNTRYTYRVAGHNGTLSAKAYAFTTLP